MNVLLLLFFYILNILVIKVDCIKKKQHRCQSKLGYTATRPMWRTQGLTLCQRYEQNTCCSRQETDKLYIEWKAGLVAGFSKECSNVIETVLCMKCDPRVGTGTVDTICSKLCDQWYDACKNEFYSGSTGTAGDSLAPCGENDVLCSPLNLIVKSGKEMCAQYGYSISDEFCYDGWVDKNAFGERERTASSSSKGRRPQTIPEIILSYIEKYQQRIILGVSLGGLGVVILFSLVSSYQKSPNFSSSSISGGDYSSSSPKNFPGTGNRLS